MKRLATAALISLTFAAHSANADEIVLEAPLEGASIQKGDIDMSVYWTEAEGGFEVVATYAPRIDSSEAARIRMLLADGDNVTFGLPGEPLVAYTFAREGDAVIVNAERNGIQFASR